ARGSVSGPGMGRWACLSSSAIGRVIALRNRTGGRGGQEVARPHGPAPRPPHSRGYRERPLEQPGFDEDRADAGSLLVVECGHGDRHGVRFHHAEELERGLEAAERGGGEAGAARGRLVDDVEEAKESLLLDAGLVPLPFLREVVEADIAGRIDVAEAGNDTVRAGEHGVVTGQLGTGEDGEIVDVAGIHDDGAEVRLVAAAVLEAGDYPFPRELDDRGAL